jgi:hypothetical protein
MNPKISVADFLAIWEKRWGKLSPDWLNAFLKDDRVKNITTYPEDLVRSAVAKNKKLDEILKEIENGLSQTKINNKEVKSNETKEHQGVNSEIKVIYDWLTRMNAAKFDPDSVFPRLDIKSDRETCEGKRKYDTEKEAIFELVRLEKVKGELVKQLPYKCNICKRFHNTHLISRETLQKLLRKYKPTKKR